MLTNLPQFTVSSGRAEAPLQMKSITLDELRQATPDEPSTPAFVPPGTPASDKRTVSPSALAQTIATEIGEAQSLKYPFRCIGRVEYRRPGEGWIYNGSGVLVGPWHLLTASHVLYINIPPDALLRFVPAYWDDTRNGDIGFRWFEANIISTIGITGIDNVNGYDYLVCELDNPLGLDWGWLGTQSSSNDGFYKNVVWTSIGYPSDLGGERPKGNLFTITDVEDDDHNGKRIKGQGDVFGGWSGGPLYGPGLWTDDTVVDVLSGSKQGTGSGDPDHVTFAGGKEMVRLVRYALDNWKRSDWSGWQPLGGSFPAGVNPAAVSRKPGLIELFCRAGDNHTWQNFRQPDTGNWSGWFQIPDPGDLSGDLAVCSMSPDHLQIFGVGTDGQMWSKWWSPQ